MSRSAVAGVISDTHGLLDPKVVGLFTGVDHILHAGDLGSLEVLRDLEALAPVSAVSGNVDEGRLPLQLHPQRKLELFDITIFMVHILGHPRRLTRAMQQQINSIHPEVVVFGHSHQPLLEKIGSVLYLNPGSAGPRRFTLPRSVGFLEVDSGQVNGRIVTL